MAAVTQVRILVTALLLGLGMPVSPGVLYENRPGQRWNSPTYLSWSQQVMTDIENQSETDLRFDH